MKVVIELPDDLELPPNYEELVRGYLLHLAEIWRASKMVIEPKCDFAINYNVRFDFIDPLSYFLIKKVTDSPFIMKKYKENGLKKHGVPSILHVKTNKSFEISQLLNRLLKCDELVDGEKVGDIVSKYIINATCIAKDKGIKDLLEYNKKIRRVLSNTKCI